MKRGVFIRNVALGSISLGLFSPAALTAFPSLAQGSQAQQWLRQLSTAFACRRRSRSLFAADSFNHAYKSAEYYFEQHHYHRQNDTAYFFGENESWCFFPVYAEQAMPDGLDLLVPVFHRDGANQWHRVKTLTAFQVEAISMASQALMAHTPAELIDMLLPSLNGGHDLGGSGYFTKSSFVSIKTTVIDGKIESCCHVRAHDGQLVWAETSAAKGLRHV